MRFGKWMGLSLLLAVIPAQAADAGLSDAERGAIEHACARALIAYTIATDQNDAKGLYGAYSKDAALHNGKGTVSGGAAIEAYFTKRVPERVTSGITTRHVLTNILIDVKDKDHARGTAYETLYRYDARNPKSIKSLAPVLLATVTTDFVRTPDGWRFKDRKVVEVSVPK